MTSDAPGAALVAERYGAPVWLIERSAAARAKASNTTIDAVYGTWAGTASAAPTPAAPTSAATPEAPPTPGPTPEPAEPAEPAAPGLTGAALLAAVAEARGLPESMIERSAKARAGAAGVDLDAVLREWAEDEGLIAPSPSPTSPPPKSSDAGAEAGLTTEPEPAPTTPAAEAAPVAAGLSGAALLTAIAEARGMPESLVERSAKGRAKKEDVSVDDVLNEWAQEAGLTTEPEPAPTTPAAEAAPVAAGLSGAALLTAIAEARGMPESLVERSAKGRAKKEDVSVDDVLNEWAQEAGLTTEPEPAPTTPAAEAAPVAAGLSGAALLTAIAEARGMPESLVERSAKGRAKKEDVSVDDVLNEWAQEAGLTTEPEPAPTTPAAEAAPVAAGLSGAALLTAIAEARGMPESLVERSAKGRAKKEDVSVDDVLNEWAQEAGLTTEPEPAPTTPAAEAAPVAAGLSGAALLTAIAEARGMPESLVERSAKGRAKEEDVSVDDVLNEWAQEAGLTTEPEPAPTTPAAEAAPVAAGLSGAALLTAIAEARGMPESLVERSAKGRAKKEDVSVDDVLNEWAQEAGLTTEPEPAPTTPAAEAAPVAAGLSGAALLTAIAEARGMPESLVERSAKGRAKKEDVSVDDVLNEWAQEAGLTTEPEPAPTTPAAEAAPVAAVAPSAEEGEPATAGGAAVEAPPEMESRPGTPPEWTRTWPGPFTVGAIAALVLLLTIAALAVFVDVPDVLTEAPVYILGLEPFLAYLDPFIALIIIPGVVLASLVVLAFAALHPATKPSLRRLTIVVLGYLALTIVVLTIIGALTS